MTEKNWCTRLVLREVSRIHQEVPLQMPLQSPKIFFTDSRNVIRCTTFFHGKFYIFLIVQSVMHIHLKILTKICHLAQMLLIGPRLELARRETIFKLPGTCQKWLRPFWGSRTYSNFWISVQEGRRDLNYTAKCPQWPHLYEVMKQHMLTFLENFSKSTSL